MIDRAQFLGPLVWLPVISDRYWMVALDRVRLGEQTVIERQSAIFDTGTSLIICPSATAKRINKLIGATTSLLNPTTATVNCKTISRLPQLWLKFGPITVQLRPQDYILRLDSTCLSAFTAMDMEDEQGRGMWILGDAFLRPYYTVYHEGRSAIGLAVGTINLKPSK